MTPPSDLMTIRAQPSRLHKTSPRAYAVRFAFGGLVTAIAGLLGMEYGPTVGGLFLAFPAILPASLTLVKKHEGEEAAGDDARGAVAGSVGLLGFGALVWGLAACLPAWQVLLFATIAWLAVSIGAWLLLERIVKKGNRAGSQASPTAEREGDGPPPGADAA